MSDNINMPLRGGNLQLCFATKRQLRNMLIGGVRKIHECIDHEARSIKPARTMIVNVTWDLHAGGITYLSICAPIGKLNGTKPTIDVTHDSKVSATLACNFQRLYTLGECEFNDPFGTLIDEVFRRMTVNVERIRSALRASMTNILNSTNGRVVRSAPSWGVEPRKKSKGVRIVEFIEGQGKRKVCNVADPEDAERIIQAVASTGAVGVETDVLNPDESKFPPHIEGINKEDGGPTKPKKTRKTSGHKLVASGERKTGTKKSSKVRAPIEKEGT